MQNEPGLLFFSCSSLSETSFSPVRDTWCQSSGLQVVGEVLVSRTQTCKLVLAESMKLKVRDRSKAPWVVALHKLDIGNGLHNKYRISF